MPAVTRTRLLLAFAAVYVIWGSSYLAIRFAIETLPGFTMAATRFLLAGAALYLWARSRGAAKPTLAHWKTSAWLGVMFFALGNGSVVWAEHHVSSGLAALLITTEPVWVVLLARRSGRAGDRLSFRVVASVLLGVVGAALLVAPSDFQGWDRSLVASLVVLAASVAWAYGSVASRDAELPASLPMAAGMQMLGGGAALAVVGAVTGEWARIDLAAASAKSLLSLAYLVTFASIVAFMSYLWLIRVAPANRVATYAYVNPLVAVFLGWWLADEPVGPRVLVAAVLILLSVLLVSQTPRRPRRQAPPAEDPTCAALPAATQAG
jgi:drug/metabolite transporter (DMT)-like permease